MSADDTPDSDAFDPRRRPIEPGRPDPEHVVFVLLGVLVTFAVALRGIGVL